MKMPGIFRRLKLTPKTAGPDLVAGVVLGVESVPDALASGVLAGVNPLYALYAVMMGTPVGAIFSGSVYLSVQTTSAMALVVASVPAVASGGSPGTLFALSLLTGVIMLVAGFLKAGRLLRWVAHSEMVGFMTGVAALIILGQLGDLTGYSSEYSNKVVKAVDLLFNLDKVDLPTVMVGISTIILILVLQKTRLRGFGLVVAIIVTSILPSLFGWDSVAKVSDIAEIAGGLPTPALPDFSQVFALIVPALSLAVIGLIQGAGVSQSFVNPDGRYPDPSRDFIGEGAANVAAGFFQGMPVGGSASATSLVVGSGARTRLANIFAGVVIAIITLLFAGAVGKLASACPRGPADSHRLRDHQARQHTRCLAHGQRPADRHGDYFCPGLADPAAIRGAGGSGPLYPLVHRAPIRSDCGGGVEAQRRQASDREGSAGHAPAAKRHCAGPLRKPLLRCCFDF